MADITKCASEKCNIKELCWRYTVEPIHDGQSYADFYQEDEDNMCCHFIINKK